MYEMTGRIVIKSATKYSEELFVVPYPHFAGRKITGF